MLNKIRKDLREFSSKEKAEILQRFFKTGPGEYGEGDIFIGVKVPEIRQLTQQYQTLPLKDVVQLLKSPIHEERLLALLIFVLKFRTADDKQKARIYDLYWKHSRHINNWDLVDLTAEHIVGAYLADKDKEPLYALAGSGILWERRIAILATFHYIKNKEFIDSFNIIGALIDDREDLIHKACGWMLREIGKRDIRAEERFLRKYDKRMPRIMLRYAIERFPEKKRKFYLRKDL